jgi:hypothetical protein
MKTVAFQLIGKYIDQIKAGLKVAEYRQLSEYNTKRLCYLSNEKELEKGEMYVQHEREIWRIRKDLTHVQFFKGYRKDRKEMLCELKAIDIKENPEGDTPGISWFVLDVGKIVTAKNF